MNEDKIKEAFVNVKKDISELRIETNNKIDELNTLVRTELRTELRTEPSFEEDVLKGVKKTKPELIKNKILQLIEEDARTTDIERIIVKEKRLCGKTQFYHYLALLRTELRTVVRSKLKAIKET